MVISQEKRNRFHKNVSISFIIVGIISVGVLGMFARLWWMGPRCTTNFFHFNIDYRLGSKDVEDNIIQEPYYKLLNMYEKHPNWKFTVECQAEMIYKIFTNTSYAEIATLTTRLLEREQMELICGLQFSQLFYAYPADVLELNLQHAYHTLNQFDLLKYRSRCLLFQEGQYGYGLAKALGSSWAAPIDTVLVSTQQIMDFRRDDYSGGNFPVYKITDSETGDSLNLLQYDYLPQWEAGYVHAWNFLLDAELGFEDDDAEQEFTVSDAKVDAYEQEMLMLELQGNQFMTCEEWVTHCETVGAVKTLDYYIPECNWGCTKYNSSYIWTANNGDSTDDGEMLANNYRARQIMLATRTIYDEYKFGHGLSVSERIEIEQMFNTAEKLWLQATVTDSTGIGPDATERITAEGNVLKVEQYCAEILKELATKLPSLNVDHFQVDLDTGKIYLPGECIQLLTVKNKNLDLADLPLDVRTSSKVIGGDDLDPDITVSQISYDSNNKDADKFDLYKLDIVFEGTHNWADDSIQNIAVRFNFPNYGKSMSELVYSPSLLENTTKRMYRWDYIYEPVYIFMPLSNGLVFIPDVRYGEQGTAIVKKVTTRHTSWLWEYWYLKILETEGLHLDAHHELYILEDVSIDQALRFANRINVNPPWIVSQDVSKIQGHEVYAQYALMENKLAEDQGSGEWW